MKREGEKRGIRKKMEREQQNNFRKAVKCIKEGDYMLISAGL